MANTWSIRWTLAIITAVVAMGAPSTAAASTGTGLNVGMEIRSDTGGCSIGFFGFNAAGQQLIVTAGHCSSYVGEEFTDAYGNPIGKVQARMGDDLADHTYGYTLIWRYSSTYIADRFFAGSGPVRVDDPIRIFGYRTGATDGAITAVSLDDGNPGHSEIASTALDREGDSGGPWYTDGPTLVGMTIGDNSNRETGAFRYSFGVPIHELVAAIRDNAGAWGDNFKILIK